MLELAVTDPETIFIILSDLLFHPLVTGTAKLAAAGVDVLFAQPAQPAAAREA